MYDFAARLADFIVNARIDEIDPGIVDKAQKVIADTFAAILAGAGSEVAPPLLALCRADRRARCQPDPRHWRTASPEMAALVNGTFGTPSTSTMCSR